MHRSTGFVLGTESVLTMMGTLVDIGFGTKTKFTAERDPAVYINADPLAKALAALPYRITALPPFVIDSMRGPDFKQLTLADATIQVIMRALAQGRRRFMF